MRTSMQTEPNAPDQGVHARRRRSNVVVGLILGAFVVLVFAVTIVKMKNGASMEAFDHVLRPSMLEEGG